MQAPLLGAAQNEGLICWKSGAVDGFFSCGKGGWAGEAHEYQGEGVPIHLLADADGMPLVSCSAPANEDDRKHVGKMIETLALKSGKAVRPRKNVRRLAADKGYYADAMENFLKKKGVQPQIPRKRNARKNGDGQCHHCATISSRTDILVAPEKAPAARRATGTIAELFPVSLLGALFCLGATIRFMNAACI